MDANTTPTPGEPTDITSRVRSRIQHILANAERQPNGCLLWKMSKSHSGYGIMRVERMTRPVAQLLWEMTTGAPISKGSILLHTCGMRNCLEITHLDLRKRANPADAAARKIAVSGSLDARFQRKITRTKEGHILWNGARKPDGSGFFRAKGKAIYACRYAWEQAKQTPVPPGMTLERKCDEPLCIAPDHHRLITVRPGPQYRFRGTANEEKAKQEYLEQFECGAPDDCWPWNGTYDRHGYGIFVSCASPPIRAHRFGYTEIHHRLIPDGWDLRNQCGLLRCQNPAHWLPEPSSLVLTNAGIPHRFNAVPRKTAERQAIRAILLDTPDASPNQVAKEVGVGAKLVRKVFQELVDEGVISSVATLRGKDGKTYHRGRKDRSAARESLKEELLRNPSQSTNALAERYDVSSTLVRRLRQQLAKDGEIPTVVVTIGLNGQLYDPRGWIFSAKQPNGKSRHTPERTSAQATVVADADGCLGTTLAGARCGNQPRSGYQYCRHHLHERRLSRKEKVEVRQARSTLACLGKELDVQLWKAISSTDPSDAAHRQVTAAVESTIADYDRMLLRSPELVTSLASAASLTGERAGLVEVWARQRCQSLEPQIRKLLGLTSPPSLVVSPALQTPFPLPADRIQIAVVEALCAAKHWKRGADPLLAWQAQVGRGDFTASVGLATGAEEAQWIRLVGATELALKLHLLLWGRYLQQTEDTRLGWAWVTVAQLCEDLGYTPHHKGGYRKDQKQEILGLVNALSSVWIQAHIPRVHDGRSARDLAGPLWVVDGELPVLDGLTLRGKTGFCFRPAPWYSSPEWRRETSYSGQIPTTFLGLQTNRDQVPIRLAAQLCIRARITKNKAVSGSISLATLIQRTSLEEYAPGRPSQIVPAIERGFELLADLRIISDWSYVDAEQPNLADLSKTKVRYDWPARR